VRLAERNHSRRDQLLDRGGRFGRDASVPALRTRGRHPVLDVQQVLQRDRQSVQRTAGEPGLALEIGRGRAIERGIAIDLDERVRVAIERRNALQARSHDSVR
jgi:hypothetical protein